MMDSAKGMIVFQAWLWTLPGEMLLTRMLLGPYSTASVIVNARIAPLLAAYADAIFCPRIPYRVTNLFKDDALRGIENELL